MLATDNPSKKLFNNFPKCLTKYWVDYCKAQGLSLSSDLARKILLYLFYAQPVFQGKASPCIRIIHHCMLTGTKRFTDSVKLLFADFIHIVEGPTDKETTTST